MHRYRYERLVQWSDCDPAGIIFYAQYAAWMSDGLMQMMLRLGVDPTTRVDQNRSRGIPSVSMSLRFLVPAKLHERVIHEVSVVRIGTASLEFAHRVLRGETVLAEAEERRVWVEVDHATSTLCSIPVPPHIRELLEADTEYAE